MHFDDMTTFLCRGQQSQHWLQIKIKLSNGLYERLNQGTWENYPISQNDLEPQHFPEEFMDQVTITKTSSIQPDVHLINCGVIDELLLNGSA